MTYADFERLLAVYGSDRDRWPVEARVRAGRLVARSLEAQQLLRETEALDRVLHVAPRPALAREAALAGRIVAAAQRSPRVVAAQPRGAPERIGMDEVSPAVGMPSYLHRGSGRSVGVGAALSAAALLAGVLIGTSLPQTLLQPVQQLTGYSSGVATSGEVTDEDYL